ncbi:TetR/AcrR family transcriptional regulator [Subtercola lobariae]|uniref:TetR family transcriptional regulator n=1 Tax=Subtercola lobariae TaxID=1588641 RepID=A0A917EWK9_9MICO|nr:TetR/AcrR family transcriptional regulator [Subtercola lobariae]GGF16795.1 TetR family transcriptional regulator [Subtercola lobariae]
METTAPLGLRDKKRAETRAKLERVAVELVLRDGLAHATVDAISDAADVSPRTFFNYFDSKEDAILGVRNPELTDDEVAQHLAASDGGGLVESIVSLLLWVIEPSTTSSELHMSRMKVVKAHPELLSRHITQMTRMADQLTAGIQTLLEKDPRFEGDSPETLQPSADVLFALCTGGVRVAVKEWVTNGSAATQDQLANLDQLERRAIELVREVTKKIQ